MRQISQYVKEKKKKPKKKKGGGVNSGHKKFGHYNKLPNLFQWQLDLRVPNTAFCYQWRHKQETKGFWKAKLGSIVLRRRAHARKPGSEPRRHPIHWWAGRTQKHWQGKALSRPTFALKTAGPCENWHWQCVPTCDPGELSQLLPGEPPSLYLSLSLDVLQVAAVVICQNKKLNVWSSNGLININS